MTEQRCKTTDEWHRAGLDAEWMACPPSLSKFQCLSPTELSGRLGRPPAVCFDVSRPVPIGRLRRIKAFHLCVKQNGGLKGIDKGIHASGHCLRRHRRKPGRATLSRCTGYRWFQTACWRRCREADRAYCALYAGKTCNANCRRPFARLSMGAGSGRSPNRPRHDKIYFSAAASKCSCRG